MRMTVRQLRSLLREELQLHEAGFVEVEDQKDHPFIDSGEGLKMTVGLSRAANEIDEVLATKFDVLVGHLRANRLHDAMSVGVGVEEHIKLFEQRAMKRVAAIKRWRDALKQYFDDYKRAAGDDLSKKKISNLIAPHVKDQAASPDAGPVDWSKEIGK